MGLLERADQIALVVERFADLDRGGHLVLISGEASVGKSALVQELLDHHLTEGRVLLGRCDDLFAPRPLGPLADIARDRPGPLAEALVGGDQASGVRRRPRRAGRGRCPPPCSCSKTWQWADEATLDLLPVSSPAASTRSPASSSPPIVTTSPHRPPDRRAIGALARSARDPDPGGPRSRSTPSRSTGRRPPPRRHAAPRRHRWQPVLPHRDARRRTRHPPRLGARRRPRPRRAPLSGPARDALDAAVVLGRHAEGSPGADGRRLRHPRCRGAPPRRAARRRRWAAGVPPRPRAPSRRGPL